MTMARQQSRETRTECSLQVCRVEPSCEEGILEMNYELATQLSLGDAALELRTGPSQALKLPVHTMLRASIRSRLRRY
jgi:hypothetical protein